MPKPVRRKMTPAGRRNRRKRQKIIIRNLALLNKKPVVKRSTAKPLPKGTLPKKPLPKRTHKYSLTDLAILGEQIGLTEKGIEKLMEEDYADHMISLAQEIERDKRKNRKQRKK